jgi:hypothetical protein
MTYTPLPDAPAWFTRALAVPRGDLEVDVAGCAIHALTFGTPGAWYLSTVAVPTPTGGPMSPPTSPKTSGWYASTCPGTVTAATVRRTRWSSGLMR